MTVLEDLTYKLPKDPVYKTIQDTLDGNGLFVGDLNATLYSYLGETYLLMSSVDFVVGNDTVTITVKMPYESSIFGGMPGRKYIFGPYPLDELESRVLWGMRDELLRLLAPLTTITREEEE